MNRKDLADICEHYLPPAWARERTTRVTRVYSLLAAGPPSRPGVRMFNLLYADTTLLSRSQNLPDLFDSLETDIGIHIGQHAKARYFVHAGVVVWQRRAIVIPGRSYVGKTELVRAFLKAGAVYYSDEFAVFDGDGLVHPFPRPLSVRERGALQGDRARTTRVRPEDLGCEAGTCPIPVRLILLTEYHQSAKWSPLRLSQGQGALALAANSLSMRNRPKATLTALQKAVEGAEIWSSRRGEAEEVVASVLQRIEAAA